MELEHTFTVAVPVEQAWAVLLDLERVAPCMPGATLTSYQGTEFAGTVRVKLGPVTMTFAGQGRFLERDQAARRMVIEAAGKDRRGGGTARATIRATLQGEGGSTVVEVHTDLVVTGRAAQFGRGMVGDVSTRLLGQFTDCLAGQLAAAPATTALVTTAPVTASPPGGPAVAPSPAAGTAPAASPAAARPVEAEPIDLLGVTGVRSAAARLVPYLLTFLAGAVAGAVVVALLLG